MWGHVPFSQYGQASPGSKKIVGVFYKANEYAALNPNFVGCVEGALGIRDWLESQGHQYIVTDDKEGPNSGQYIVISNITYMKPTNWKFEFVVKIIVKN